jgi:hypothetical protein
MAAGRSTSPARAARRTTGGASQERRPLDAPARYPCVRGPDQARPSSLARPRRNEPRPRDNSGMPRHHEGARQDAGDLAASSSESRRRYPTSCCHPLKGSSTTVIERSHFTWVIPYQPGTISRSGKPCWDVAQLAIGPGSVRDAVVARRVRSMPRLAPRCSPR